MRLDQLEKKDLVNDSCGNRESTTYSGENPNDPYPSSVPRMHMRKPPRQGMLSPRSKLQFRVQGLSGYSQTETTRPMIVRPDMRSSGVVEAARSFMIIVTFEYALEMASTVMLIMGGAIVVRGMVEERSEEWQNAPQHLWILI